MRFFARITVRKVFSLLVSTHIKVPRSLPEISSSSKDLGGGRGSLENGIASEPCQKCALNA